MEEIFDRDFYKQLYDTYPKIDDSWRITNNLSKYQLGKLLLNIGKEPNVPTQKIESSAWNKLIEYAQTEEFLDHFKKFTGIPNLKCKYFNIIAYEQGGFQLSHCHNFGHSTFTIMLYFSKGWNKGDAGGTFLSSGEDESSILFEPYNLDNTMAFFLDGPNSWHGARYITKDVVRQAAQITLEGYSPESGWSGGHGIENILKGLKEEQ